MINKAWQKTILKPESLRIPHWYTNSNVLLYVDSGNGFVSMLDSIGDGNKEKSYNFMIEKGDVLALPIGFFHTILNISNEDLVFYEAFMSGNTNEISILKGIQSLDNDVASGALGLSKENTARMLSHKAPNFIVKF
jgi:oxalate decarboxylase/phosphoglucose isomerase-like protein (cupin superfamily)